MAKVFRSRSSTTWPAIDDAMKTESVQRVSEFGKTAVAAEWSLFSLMRFLRKQVHWLRLGRCVKQKEMFNSIPRPTNQCNGEQRYLN